MWNDCLLIKTLSEKFETMISTSSSLFIQSKLQFVASSEFQTKLKSFKSEEFAVNFNSSSTSTKSSLESVTQSNVILAASSIFTSVSKNSKVISSRSISSCSTRTILLINQSNYLFVANQLVAQIWYQHIVITFFFNYDKCLTTFKKWFYTSFTSKTLTQAEFRYTFTKLSLNCTTCRRCDLIFENWEFHDDFFKEHLRRNSECFKAKRAVEQKAMKQEIAAAVVETIKSEICVKNINFFDLQCK